jgi:hypothetical protein
MNINHYNEPWRHMVVESFLTDKELLYLQHISAQIKVNSPDSIHRYSAVYTDDCIINSMHGLSPEYGGFWLDYIDKDFTDNLYQRIKPLVYEWADLLKTESLIKSPGIVFELSSKGPGLCHQDPRHVDMESKQLTVCAYIYPEDSRGTLLFESKEAEEPYKEIEWNPGDALVFTRRHNHTWHEVPVVDHQRTVLNINLTDAGEFYGRE